jgi:hypothetical protein
VGWLHANKGNWNGEQILARAYVEQCMTPIKVPIMAFRRTARPDEVLSRVTYGLVWRGRCSDNGGLLWHMSGNGGQFCAVLAEHGIVLTKINGIWRNNQPFLGLGKSARSRQTPSPGARVQVVMRSGQQPDIYRVQLLRPPVQQFVTVIFPSKPAQPPRTFKNRLDSAVRQEWHSIRYGIPKR